MKYECVETFSVPMLDEFEGNETGEEFKVLEGSVWESEEPVAASDSEVFLTRDDGGWLDISRDLFESMFNVELEVSVH